MKKKLDFIWKYFMYLVRWQLSTVILAPVIAYIKQSGSIWGTWEDWYAAIIANLIGGLIFFWIDGKFIFNSPIFRKELWEVKENVTCADCGKQGRGYRLILKKTYDRTDTENIEFRCEECSQKKYRKQFMTEN